MFCVLKTIFSGFFYSTVREYKYFFIREKMFIKYFCYITKHAFIAIKIILNKKKKMYGIITTASKKVLMILEHCFTIDCFKTSSPSISRRYYL